MRRCNEEKGKNENENEKKRKANETSQSSAGKDVPLQAYPHFLALWKSPFTMYAVSLQTLILKSNTNSALLSAYLSDNFLLPD